MYKIGGARRRTVFFLIIFVFLAIRFRASHDLRPSFRSKKIIRKIFDKKMGRGSITKQYPSLPHKCIDMSCHKYHIGLHRSSEDILHNISNFVLVDKLLEPFQHSHSMYIDWYLKNKTKMKKKTQT